MYITYKKCSKCGIEKKLSEFNKQTIGKFGVRSKCKLCRKEYRLEIKEQISIQHKKYYINNLQHINEYKETHKDKIRKYNNEYKLRNKEKIAAQTKLYRINNKNKINIRTRKYCNNKRKSDISFRLQGNLRSRITHAINQSLGDKAYKSMELLGCTIKECRQHLETQFKDIMSWNNYGEWQVDHIRPCASFDLTDPEQQKQCFNYKNLQPLWAKENRIKSDKWEEK